MTADQLLKKAVEATALSSKDEPLLAESIQECVDGVIDAMCDAAYERAVALEALARRGIQL